MVSFKSSVCLLFCLLLSHVSAIDFDEVFAAKPSLRTAKPVPTISINKAAVASSVISAMKKTHLTVNPSKTAVKTARATHKPRTRKATHKKASAKKASGKKDGSKKAGAKKAGEKNKINEKKAAHAKAIKKHPKRQATSSAACAAEIILFNYVPTPNTPTGFLVDGMLGNTSTVAKPPAGYSTNFTGAYASVDAISNSYLGYYQLPTYNITQCAAICDSMSACQAFNIYFEREPTVVPGTSCSNPNAAAIVHCVLWGSYVNAGQATNIGQWQQDFMVVITGSNGYNKNVPPLAVSNFTVPVALPAAVDSQTSAGQLLNSSFDAAGFDAASCANQCQVATSQNRAAAVAAGSATYSPCNWFNVFDITYNGTMQGMYCQLFTNDSTPSATLYTQTVNSVSYGLTYSYAYALSVLDSGVISSASASSTSTSSSSPTTAASSSYAFSSSYSTAVISSAGPSSIPSSASSTAASISLSKATTTTTTVAPAAYVTTSVNSGTGSTISTVTIAPATAGGTATVQIQYPTAATTCSNSGASYAGYTDLITNVLSIASFLPERYKTITPLYSGSTSYIGEYNDALNTAVSIYGTSGRHGSNLVLDHTFYLFAGQTGSYTLNLAVATEIAYIWTGAKALSGWTGANANASQLLGSTNLLSVSSVQVSATIGQYIPVRVLWGNMAGAGALQFTITSPDGNSVMASTPNANAGTSSPNVVQFPCNAAYGAAFAAWGSET